MRSGRRTRDVVIVGIDYSITSPALCVCNGDTFTLDNLQFYYKTLQKSKISTHPKFIGSLIPKNLSQVEKFDYLAEWVMTCIDPLNVIRPKVLLENYAFGAKGMVFHIGENGGVLKNKLFHGNINCEVASPGTIKKFATGRGNAKKHEIIDAFEDETKLDLHKIIGTSRDTKNSSPTNDIADSYFICKYLFEDGDVIQNHKA